MKTRLGLIKRQRAIITVTIDGRERRFTLRAQSIAEHLELLELQEAVRQEALTAAASKLGAFPKAAAARADQSAVVAIATHLLQEPADGGQPLLEREGWLLALGDPARVMALQRELTDVERVLKSASDREDVSMDEVAGNWLDVASTIARARMAPDAQTPLTSWSVEQLIETYHRACRELWNEQALQIRCAGGDPGKEPDFKTGKPSPGRGGVDSAPFTEEDEVRYAAMKAEIEAGFAQGTGPAFPYQGTRVEQKAFKDAVETKQRADYDAATRDPDGRKFPGTL